MIGLSVVENRRDGMAELNQQADELLADEGLWQRKKSIKLANEIKLPIVH